MKTSISSSKTSSNTPTKIDFAVGGQALIEGVLMRSPNYNIVAVRTPSGDIQENSEFYQNLIVRRSKLNIPIVRGVINMLEMMLIGTKALNFSSKIALSENIEKKSSVKSETAATDNKEKPAAKPSLLENASLLFSVFFALAMSIFLFKFMPLWITDYLSHKFAILEQNYLLFNLLDGILKTSFFIAYIAILSLLPDVKRVFQYHGAEHKSIMTYEQGLPLTVENAAKQTRFHPRCGTSFILIVFLISIFIFTAVPRQSDFLANFALRLFFLPFVAGVSYEFLKLSAKMPENWFFKVISKPGLLMQKLTTAEPDAQMLEVALKSLSLALESENKLKSKTNAALL